MEYIKQFFAQKNTRVNARNGDIAILTAYRGFPRNAMLPPGAPSHILERLIKEYIDVRAVCRSKIPRQYVFSSLFNRSRPTMMKVVYNTKTNAIVGLTVAHVKKKYLYVDLLCTMERKKNGSTNQKGFGTILIEELKKEGTMLGAEYILLDPIPSAFYFYEKKGFTFRNQESELMQLKVPKMSPATRARLLPQGVAATPFRTTKNAAMIQSALRTVKTAKSPKTVKSR
jgi:hypothetical protein